MLNRCEFIGNLGADPEQRRTQSGKPVVNLRLAVSKKWRDSNGERQERTTWVPIVIFSEGLCKVAESYLRKGSQIYVSGELSVRKWQDQSGQDRYSTEIVLQGFDATLVMLDGPKGERTQQSYNDGTNGPAREYGSASAEPEDGGTGTMDDMIPFEHSWK